MPPPPVGVALAQMASQSFTGMVLEPYWMEPVSLIYTVGVMPRNRSLRDRQ